MNRQVVVTTVLIVFAMSVVSCGNVLGVLMGNQVPPCPDWVSDPVFVGQVQNVERCYSDTPPVVLSPEGAKISLKKWEIGQLKLNNAKLSEAFNLDVYDQNGIVLTDYSKMDRKLFYSFAVTGDGAYLVLKLRGQPDPWEGETRLRVARLP